MHTHSWQGLFLAYSFLFLRGSGMTAIINIETLQVFNSLTDCAKAMQTSVASIHRALKNGRKVKHFKIEYLEDWLQWEPEVKERYCRWGNVGFYTFSVDFCDNFSKKPYDYVKKSHLGEEKAGARSAHHMI